MKFSLFIILLITFSIYSDAQTSACPSISVLGPTQPIMAGESMTFTANVKGENVDKIEYKWTVSKGTIVSGQETPVIVVATNKEMAEQTVTATVEIIGLPKDCANQASATGEIYLPKGDIFPFDRYNKIPFNDEKARLSILLEEVKNYKDEGKIVFVFSKSKKDNRELLKNRLVKIEKYLTETLKLSKDKFLFAFRNSNSYKTEFWFIPSGAEFPKSNDDKITQDNWQKRFDETFPTTKKSSRKPKK